MSRVDINSVIRTAVELVSGQIRDARDRFTLSLAAGLPPVRGNSLWLEQVIVNLVMNACQALPRRGKLSFRSQPGEGTESVITLPTEEL